MLAKTELLKKLQLIAGSPKTEEIMVGIGKKFGLEDDRLSLVTRAVGNMLFGDLHPNFLIAHLAKVLVIQKEEARAIAHEISGQVLAQARNELAALYNIIPPDRATTPLPTAPPVISRQQAPNAGQPQSPDIVRPPMPQMPPPAAVSIPPVRPPVPPSPAPTPSPSLFHSPVPAPSLAQNTPPPPQPAPQQGAPAQKAETPFGPQEELMRLYRMARPGTSAPTEHEPAPPPPPSQKPVSPPTAAPQRTPANDAHPPVVDLREE